ncbi:MAG: HAMP domain-containing histidine kinase, partial [Dechloromonas sp.]|nr:HAMP domain-containing histidine kinase [Dechloromonas sp.]
TSVELLSQLLIDIFALSALVFFSGGATNPLVSLLLPPVAIAALTLPVRCVAAVGVIAIAAYSALMFFYVPLAMSDATRATRLHLLGMWLTFAVSALMVAWFAVRMTKLIRQRDAELAAVREQALRDERIMAIGTLAAGAAHELGTPLGTMALVAGELARDPQLSDAAREDVALLRQQIGVCKEIITGLTRRAGAERLEDSGAQAVDVWLQGVRQRWHALRPQAESRVEVTGSLPAPRVANDPRLEQALLNLLNNAANVSAAAINIRLGWTGERILIDIHDLGPGFPPDVLQQGGQASFPPHENGSGIGLMLTRSAIEQLGGRLSLLNPPEGGALARLELNQRT